MATYEGRLTDEYLRTLEGDGPALMRTRGRGYGGVRFFAGRWTAFAEDAVEMARLERGVALGHLEIRKVAAKRAPGATAKKSSSEKKATSAKGRGRGSSKRRRNE
ncbi:MAG: hypothetical protein GTN49_04995 [candidate division Zixibacteria bacterium]|nr:hypothetical protein [candidate division Zixibacteria bacterium]